MSHDLTNTDLDRIILASTEHAVQSHQKSSFRSKPQKNDMLRIIKTSQKDQKKGYRQNLGQKKQLMTSRFKLNTYAKRQFTNTNLSSKSIEHSSSPVNAEQLIKRKLSFNDDEKELVVNFYDSPIININKSTGVLKLSCNNFKSSKTLLALNMCLHPFSMIVQAVPNNPSTWLVLENGATIGTFFNEMEINETTKWTKNRMLARASVLKQYLMQKLKEI